MNGLKNKNILYYLVLSIIIALGIGLRLKGYLINPSFWHDECGLAWNIKFKSYHELFGILRFLQVTPPLFSITTKLLTNIFGYSEKVFRLIPFLTGCLSAIAFYFLCAKFFTKKVSILTAVLLFAINSRLINFSFEFKPYGVDAFFTIVVLLFFVNLDIEKLNSKKAFIYGILLALIPWFSFVSVFAIAGGGLNLFISALKRKDKKLLFIISSFLLPLLISALFYLKVFLFNNYTGTSMATDWQNYFVTLNPLKFLNLMSESFRYLFFPIEDVLFTLILFFAGFFLFIKEKSKKSDLLLITFVLFLIASFFHIYPFSNRIILFLTPLYLLFMLKPLDLVSFNKRQAKSLLILVFVLITFYPQFTWINYFVTTNKKLCKGEYPREMMEFMVKNLKKDDIIFVSNLSNTEFDYYSSFYEINNKVINEPQISNRIDVLNSIEKDKYCWFFLTFANSESVINWINKNAKIIKELHAPGLNDYLIYVYIK